MPMFARSAGLTCEAGCEVFSWNANGGCATASVVAASRIPRTSLVDCKLLNAYIHFLARSACWCRPYGTQFDLALYPGLTPGAKSNSAPAGLGLRQVLVPCLPPPIRKSPYTTSAATRLLVPPLRGSILFAALPRAYAL